VASLGTALCSPFLYAFLTKWLGTRWPWFASVFTNPIADARDAPHFVSPQSLNAASRPRHTANARDKESIAAVTCPTGKGPVTDNGVSGGQSASAAAGNFCSTGTSTVTVRVCTSGGGHAAQPHSHIRTSDARSMDNN